MTAIRCDIDETKRFLQGKMNADEATAFQQNLETDPQFREEFDFNKDLLESMRIHYKSVLKGKLQNLEDSEETPAPKKTKQRSFWQISSIAAAIALLFVIGYALLFNRADTESVFDQYYSPYYNVLDGTERSVGNENTDLAMRLYDQQRYEEALLVFEEAITQNPQNTGLLFYKAISHLSLEQPDSAIATLNHIVNQPDNQFQEPAQWYLGLSYLQKGNTEKAKTQFETIESSNNSYSDRARNILDALH